ncbi:MAG: hypothetical protein ACF8XB_13650 [Planctomycetota bacterium JB042]
MRYPASMRAYGTTTAVLLLAAACGRGDRERSAAEVAAAALADHEAALAAADASPADRFFATLESARCLARLLREDEGLRRLRTLYPRFDARMEAPGSHRYLLWFLDDVAAGPSGPERAVALEEAILKIVRRRHRTKVTPFRDWFDRMRERVERSTFTPDEESMPIQLTEDP